MSTQTLKELEKLYSKQELLDLIATRRADVLEAERQKRNEARNNAVEEIKGFLQTAEMALRDAAELADQYGIDFTFADPKNHTCDFRAGWQSSSCYASDGWYAAETFGDTPARSVVDGQPVDSVVDYGYRSRSWQSSSADC